MEFRRQKHQPIGRSKPNTICKQHPKHQQCPGVCSICLREKLSQLSTSLRSNYSTNVATSCSTSSLSSLSSSNASSYSSPVHRIHRMDSEARGRSMIFMRASRNVLTKSRSLAVAAITRRRNEEGVDQGKKKSKFWSKLLRPRGKRIGEGLFHSRTLRERLATEAY